MERKFNGSESSLYGLFAPLNESAEERKGLESLVMGVCDVVRLLWSKADVYDLVHSRYFTIWPRFGTWYLRFGN